MSRDNNTARLQETIIERKSIALASITRFPTPMATDNEISDACKIELIEEKMRDILNILGLDIEDPSLQKTPYRIAKMYVEEIFSGLKHENFPKISFFDNPLSEASAEQVVYCNDIRVNSFCEHHLIPFKGLAHVAYIPSEKVIGLSKINRIVDYFCKRPQIQERLTVQIADSLSQLLATEDIAVSITATHHCVTARGIQDETSNTTTLHLQGNFKIDPSLRNEFMQLATGAGIV